MLATLKIKSWKNIGTSDEKVVALCITVRLDGFREILFADDIVEVLNAANGAKQQYVGNRYYITGALPFPNHDSTFLAPVQDGINVLRYYIEVAKVNYNNPDFAASQLVLYKRPLKNWFKYFWLLRTKKYIKKDIK